MNWDPSIITATPLSGWQMAGMVIQSLLMMAFLFPTMIFIALTVDPVSNFSAKVCRCDEPAPTWRKVYRTGNAVIVALINEVGLVGIMWIALFNAFERRPKLC